MGANTFSCVAQGATADEAFRVARDAALYEYGHRGYTGTIAEKHDFRIIPVPAGVNPRAYANQLMNDDDSRISDKWGPAGCIVLREPKGKVFGEYLFFGWASS